MSGEFDQSQLNSIKHDLKELTPQRCRNCSKTEIDMSLLALRVVNSEITVEDATSAAKEKAQDVRDKCNGARPQEGCFGGYDDCRYGIVS